MNMSESMIRIIENEIIERLKKGEAVVIESGAANDLIVGYKERRYKKYFWCEYEEREITFETTACIFPERISLAEFDSVDYEEFKGDLFISVE